MPGPCRYAVVLAAGRGVRMRSSTPKLLHTLCGRTLIECVLDALAAAGVPRIVAVTPDADGALAKVLRDRGATLAPQPEPRGTGDAVARALAAAAALGEGPGPALVVNGDLPLLRGETLAALLEAHAHSGASATMLAGRAADPRGWGRIVRGAGGEFLRVVEERDATAEERALAEVNVGPVALDPALVAEALREVAAATGPGEVYFPAALEVLRRRGLRVRAETLAGTDEVAQVNTLEELGAAATALRRRILAQHLAAGVVIADPEQTHIEWGVEIGSGTVIHPFTTIRRGVRIGRHCEVGPNAHLRPGTVLEDRAEIGNFVEAKNTSLGAGSKAKHLTYLGDAEVGSGVNVGAGTITANYDGQRKHRTVIEDRAFIGSGTILVAPVRVGEGGVTGAGAVVTRGRDVPPGETVVGVPAKPIRNGRGKPETRPETREGRGAGAGEPAA
ncbi:MAG: NTP transferase domain-containing protein [Planctomycetales bacterium]|nr:NTP transferase domain-containing protein [Planctomycetales bacterium]